MRNKELYDEVIEYLDFSESVFEEGGKKAKEKIEGTRYIEKKIDVELDELTKEIKKLTMEIELYGRLKVLVKDYGELRLKMLKGRNKEGVDKLKRLLGEIE